MCPNVWGGCSPPRPPASYAYGLWYTMELLEDTGAATRRGPRYNADSCSYPWGRTWLCSLLHVTSVTCTRIIWRIGLKWCCTRPERLMSKCIWISWAPFTTCTSSLLWTHAWSGLRSAHAPQTISADYGKDLFKGWITQFGLYLSKHTPTTEGNYTSQLFSDLCNLLESSKTRTTPYQPSSNGQVERCNQTILSYILYHLKQDDTL